MAIKRQAGFTLIELIITLAISMGLAVIALVGFSSLRAQTQFSDSVERVREAVLQRRTEANSTVQLTNGDNGALITLGRVMTFQPNTGTVVVRTLTTSSTQNPTPAQTVTATASNTVTYTIPWGVLYQGVQSGASVTSVAKQIAFVRSPVDGSLHTAVSPNGGWGGMASGTYQYQDFIGASVPAPVSLSITDGTRQAWIDINPAVNGVARRFK